MHKVAAWIAFVFAAIACAFAAYGALRPLPDAATMEERVYRRIIQEVWIEVAPVYKDFDMPMPQEPQTVTELIRPFLSVQPSLPKEP